MDLRNLTLKAVMAKVGEEQVKRVRAEIADALLDTLDPGDRKHATLSDGTDVGTISVSQTKVTAVVKNEAAFLAWVKQNRPDAVVTTEVVRESDRRILLEHALRDGALLPGVEFVPGGGNLTVSVSDGQRQALAAAYQAGAIDMADLELPEGLTDDL